MEVLLALGTKALRVPVLFFGVSASAEVGGGDWREGKERVKLFLSEGALPAGTPKDRQHSQVTMMVSTAVPAK